MKRKWKIFLGVCGSVIAVAGAALAAFVLYGKAQTNKIPAMSFESCLEYTLGGSEDGVITVGIIKDGIASYTVYGKDGKVIPKASRTYEIGSLTKTFTAALIQKAVTEDKINLSDTIDKYLTLPEKNCYPSIEELLTHTSGFKGYYFEAPMIGNFFADRNDYCGITDKMVYDKLASLNMKKSGYKFKYSNYGYAVLGLVLEKVYGEEYTALINRFMESLGLSSTHVSSEKSDLEKPWEWRENDAYIPAGALTSNIEDMLRYAQLQLDKDEIFASCHKVIKEVNEDSSSNRAMDINMDSIGMAWITDKENGIVWHNGGTDNYNCYLGFCPESGTAVVILSNLAPSYRIPATVMGVKLLTETKS